MIQQCSVFWYPTSAWLRCIEREQLLTLCLTSRRMQFVSGRRLDGFDIFASCKCSIYDQRSNNKLIRITQSTWCDRFDDETTTQTTRRLSEVECWVLRRRCTIARLYRAFAQVCVQFAFNMHVEDETDVGKLAMSLERQLFLSQPVTSHKFKMVSPNCASR